MNRGIGKTLCSYLIDASRTRRAPVKPVEIEKTPLPFCLSWSRYWSSGTVHRAGPTFKPGAFSTFIEEYRRERGQ